MRKCTLILAASILAVSILGFPPSATATESRELCSTIGYVIGQSASRFESIAGEPVAASGEWLATVELPESSRCVVGGVEDRRAYYCRWDFPYRDPSANAQYASLADDLRQCIGHLADEQVEGAANHPDTYLSRRYDLARGSVILSVKDKVARDGTFVFVRVEKAAKSD